MIFRKTSDDEEGGAAIYGMAQTFSDRSMVDLMAKAYLDSMYSTKADLQWFVMKYTFIQWHYQYFSNFTLHKSPLQ